MFKSAIRAAPRRILPSRTVLNTNSRRSISTAPPSRKSRTWKGAAARWGLALGGIYYYNTSNFFAEEPEGRRTVNGVRGKVANRTHSCYSKAR